MKKSSSFYFIIDKIYLVYRTAILLKLHISCKEFDKVLFAVLNIRKRDMLVLAR